MHVKGVSFVNKRYAKRLPFLLQTAYNKGKGLDIREKPPRIKLWRVPRFPYRGSENNSRAKF